MNRAPTDRRRLSRSLRQVPRAVSVVTFQRGADWFGITATSLSSFSVDPPTILLSFDCAAAYRRRRRLRRRSASASSPRASRDRDRSGVGLWSRRARTISREVGSRRRAVLSSIRRVAALECESEEIIDRHGRAIVIGRIRNVFKIGGSGALVYWRGAYNSIGWTDEEVRRAVGLFPAAR